ncbi:RNA-directed DNA polymerase [Gossypium australe]|uniref:RNA-directed DNA polymerase n=1 Tax=Gossypium australe TaxID=47621 RepID=A0A5B6X1U1_9ROSI|nr:RNA-directed DNA polymerase [Gossypium australe]
MIRAYDKKVHLREFHEGDLREMDSKLGRTLCGKEGLFWRSADLTEMDGKNLPYLVNSDSVKKYFT